MGQNPKLRIAPPKTSMYHVIEETNPKNFGGIIMESKEMELLEIIRTSENPQQALEIAAKVIIYFLQQSESCPKSSAVCPREPDETEPVTQSPLR